ncbi:hypothetical protein COOONC_22090 [Cooperia oncophora]
MPMWSNQEKIPVLLISNIYYGLHFAIQILIDLLVSPQHLQNFDVIYFNFQKTFDKVIPSILLHKLMQVGIHERIIKWIKEFLSERTFQVRIGTSLSKVRECSKWGSPRQRPISSIIQYLHISICRLQSRS